MARSENQKLKLMYLVKILSEKTDTDHGMTLEEITENLSAYDIKAERKSLYSDFELLRDFGHDIICEKEGRKFVYKMVGRDFELPELKLLVDAVQSSKLITQNKSNNLIKKIEGLASVHEAKSLHRQVFVANRIKSTNESILYTVDEIHRAIANNNKIKFQYYQWNIKKEKELRHNGAIYEISPWGLSWDDENYYLIGYDSADDKIKHFRVDKMVKASVDEASKREGKDKFKSLDVAIYTKKVFGMYGGQEETVVLSCENSMAGVIIDRFGKEVSIVPTDDEHFNARVNVQISPQFFGWVFSLGDAIKVIGPDEVVEKMKRELNKISSIYK